MEGINRLKGRDLQMENKEMVGTTKKNENHSLLKIKILKRKTEAGSLKENKRRQRLPMLDIKKRTQTK